jgi:hypothetical protein
MKEDEDLRELSKGARERRSVDRFGHTLPFIPVEKEDLQAPLMSSCQGLTDIHRIGKQA